MAYGFPSQRSTEISRRAYGKGWSRPAPEPAIAPVADCPLLQDAELFLLTADDPREIGKMAERIAEKAHAWNKMGMALAARESVCRARNPLAWRAAIVARSPSELTLRLLNLSEAARRGNAFAGDGFWLGAPESAPTIAFVFPASNAAVNSDPSIWSERFVEAKSQTAPGSGLASTQAQPCAKRVSRPDQMQAEIASFVGWKLLERCNVKAKFALCSSNARIAAFTWAGVIDEDDFKPLINTMADAGPCAATLSGFAFDTPSQTLIDLNSGDAFCDASNFRELLSTNTESDCTRSKTGEVSISAELIIDLAPANASASAVTGSQTMSIDPMGHSVQSLLQTLGQCYVSGVPVNVAALYEDRPMPNCDPLLDDC